MIAHNNKMKGKNTGKQSEEIIGVVNDIYNRKGKALIQGIPEPTRITAKNKKGKYEMVHHKESTVDYFGISRGTTFAFDVKSTVDKTKFDLKNIGEHQISYLMNFEDQEGIGFFLIHFVSKKEWYFAPVKAVWEYWIQAYQGKGRKYIPYADFKENKQFKKIPRGKVGVDYIKFLNST